MNRSMFINIHRAGPHLDSRIYGNKASKLALMAYMGINIPPGFIIPIRYAQNFRAKGFVNSIRNEFQENLNELIKFSKLISVRSGAATTLPGLLLTMLNVGWTKQTLDDLSNEVFLRPLFISFLEQYCREVANIDIYTSLNSIMDANNIDINGPEWNLVHIKQIFSQYEKITRRIFPLDAFQQTIDVAWAVAHSWEKPTSELYREITLFSGPGGTAIIFQSMVYGNYNSQSGSGVFYTRSLNSKEEYYYEFVPHKQGIDLLSGSITPTAGYLEIHYPSLLNQLIDIGRYLERELKNPQEIEFTIQDNVVWILQTRDVKTFTSPDDKIYQAKFQLKLPTKDTSLTNITNLLIGRGLSISSGVLTGCVAFSEEEIKQLRQVGNKFIILVKKSISPNDIKAIASSDGLITQYGGATSHAAVLARRLNKISIVGLSNLQFVLGQSAAISGDIVIHKGDTITLDAFTGAVYLGRVDT